MKLKVTKAMRDDLLAIADDNPPKIPLKRLQFALDFQGYYAGVRYRYYPHFEKDGQFTGWLKQERIFGQ